MQGRLAAKVKQPWYRAEGAGPEAIEGYQTWAQALRKKAALFKNLQLQYQHTHRYDSSYSFVAAVSTLDTC